MIGSSAELVAILPRPQCTPFWNPFQTRNLRPCHLGPFWNAACTMPQVRSASGRRSTFTPASQNIPTAPKPYSGRRRSSRSCFKPIRFKHSDKPCQCHRFRVTTHQAFRGIILPHGSIQFRANPRWIPFRERRIVLMACSPTPFYDPEKPIRCTYSPATSNGNGGKTPALPGNCCRQRRVRIRIRGLTPARCSPVPVISPAQGRVRRAGLAGSEDALSPRRTR